MHRFCLGIRVWGIFRNEKMHFYAFTHKYFASELNNFLFNACLYFSEMKYFALKRYAKMHRKIEKGEKTAKNMEKIRTMQICIVCKFA